MQGLNPCSPTYFFEVESGVISDVTQHLVIEYAYSGSRGIWQSRRPPVSNTQLTDYYLFQRRITKAEIEAFSGKPNAAFKALLTELTAKPKQTAK